MTSLTTPVRGADAPPTHLLLATGDSKTVTRVSSRIGWAAHGVQEGGSWVVSLGCGWIPIVRGGVGCTPRAVVSRWALAAVPSVALDGWIRAERRTRSLDVWAKRAGRRGPIFAGERL